MDKSRNNAAQTYGSLNDGDTIGRGTARCDIVDGADVVGLGNTIAVVTDDDPINIEGIRVVAVTAGRLNETLDQLPICTRKLKQILTTQVALSLCLLLMLAAPLAAVVRTQPSQGVSAQIAGRESRVPKSKVTMMDENMASIVCVVVAVKVGESMRSK